MKSIKLFTILILVVAITTGLQAQKAQKKQLKVAEKALKKKKYDEALQELEGIKNDLQLLKVKDQAKFYWVKAEALYQKQAADAPNMDAGIAVLALVGFEKANKLKKYTPKVKYIRDSLVARFLRIGTKDYDAENFVGAHDNFKAGYTISPRDTVYLENAGLAAFRGKAYDQAIACFEKLIELGYTGIKKTFAGTEVVSGEKQYFANQKDLNMQVRFGVVKNPEIKSTPSRAGNIVKNIAFCYIAKEDNEGALKAIEKAKKRFPNDYTLVINEANIHYKLGHKDKFLAGLKRAIELKPDDPMLHYNIGVMTMQEKLFDKAEKYFKKAIELDPEMFDAYINLSNIKLEKQEAVVEEMNQNLNNFKKYDELKIKQQEILKGALPYLVKAHELKPKDEGTIKTLISLYEILLMEEERKAMIEKREAL